MTHELQRTCEICGKPRDGTEAVGHCAACAVKYELGACSTCGVRMVQARASGPMSPKCSRCRAQDMIGTFSPDVLGELDAKILGNDIMAGLELLRAQPLDGGLDPLDLYSARYAQLRARRPAAFTCSHEDYWKGFYSQSVP